MPTSPHNIRVDDDLWSRAVARAADEGSNLSALMRQWLTDYVEKGSIGKRQPKVRLSAAEQRALRERLSGFADVLADTINEQR
jgi:hypothetical protein